MGAVARLSKADENHHPEAGVLPIVHVVILSRQRPQAATREHTARVRDFRTSAMPARPTTRRCGWR
jgi:hypothetical protein